VADIEGEGKEKKAARKACEREGSLLLSSQYSRSCFDPYPPFPTAAMQANLVRTPPKYSIAVSLTMYNISKLFCPEGCILKNNLLQDLFRSALITEGSVLEVAFQAFFTRSYCLINSCNRFSW